MCTPQQCGRRQLRGSSKGACFNARLLRGRHMLFCSVVSFGLVKTGVVAPVEGMTLDIYKVCPVAHETQWVFACTMIHKDHCTAS